MYGLSILKWDSEDEDCVLDLDLPGAGERAGDRVYTGAKIREVCRFRSGNSGFRIGGLESEE